MSKRISALAVMLLAATAAFGQSEVTLTRIDCGTGAKPTNVAAFNPALQGSFTDTYAYWYRVRPS